MSKKSNMSKRYTAEPEDSATTARVARQQIFHDPARPSRIVLPVVPG